MVSGSDGRVEDGAPVCLRAVEWLRPAVRQRARQRLECQECGSYVFLSLSKPPAGAGRLTAFGAKPAGGTAGHTSRTTAPRQKQWRIKDSGSRWLRGSGNSDRAIQRWQLVISPRYTEASPNVRPCWWGAMVLLSLCVLASTFIQSGIFGVTRCGETGHLYKR